MFAIPGLYKALGILAAVVVLFGTGFAAGHNTEEHKFEEYKASVDRASADARAAAQVHNDQVLDTARRDQAATIATYQERLNEAENARSTAAAANVADALRGVYVPVTACNRDADAKVAPGPRRPDGEAGPGTARLQSTFAVALFSVGTDADSAIGRRDAQIAALQARVRQDLVEINGSYSEAGGADSP